MELSCPLGISGLVPQDQRSLFGVLSHIINPLSPKFVRSRWLDIGLVLFFRAYGPRRINTKKKNLASILTSRLVNNPYIFLVFPFKDAAAFDTFFATFVLIFLP